MASCSPPNIYQLRLVAGVVAVMFKNLSLRYSVRVCPSISTIPLKSTYLVRYDDLRQIQVYVAATEAVLYAFAAMYMGRARGHSRTHVMLRSVPEKPTMPTMIALNLNILWVCVRRCYIVRSLCCKSPMAVTA